MAASTEKLRRLGKLELVNVATQIATSILTVYAGTTDGIECHRAQMMLKQADGTEKNMGGRNKDSLVKEIMVHLQKLMESPEVEPVLQTYFIGLKRDFRMWAVESTSPEQAKREIAQTYGFRETQLYVR